MAKENTSNGQPVKMTQKSLESMIEKIIGNKVASAVEKALGNIGEQLNEVVSTVSGATRPNTKVNSLMERKRFLLEQLQEVESELSALGASSQSVVPRSLKEHVMQQDQNAANQMYAPQPQQQGNSAYQQLGQSLLERTRAAAQQKMAQSFGTTLGPVQQVAQNMAAQDHIMQNVMTAGTSPVDNQKEQLIREKFQEKMQRPMSDQQRKLMEMVMNTPGTVDHMQQ